MSNEPSTARFGALDVFHRSLATRVPLGVAYIDRDLRYLWVSDALASMNGLSAEEHRGRRVSEVLPPTIADGLEVILQGVIDSGDPFEDFDVTFGPGVGHASDGGTLSVVASFYAVGEDEVLGVVGIIQEST